MPPFSFLCSVCGAYPKPLLSPSNLTTSCSKFTVFVLSEPLLRRDQVISDRVRTGISPLGEFSGQKYNLSDLCQMFQPCKLKRKQSDEEAAGEYLFHCLNNVDDVRRDDFHVNQVVQSWEQLSLFISASTHIPDIAITNKSGDHILIVEVHSGNGFSSFEGTAHKVVIGLVAQLRDLRNKSDIQSLVGFAFPNRKESHYVVRVTVDFAPLCFRYSFKILQKAEVFETVKDAFKHNCDPLIEDKRMCDPKHGFPLRLSKITLEE